jgi:CRISPR-associated protein Csh2
MSNFIKNNADFLFLYEAIQCNPNGDPDQENRPRMDMDTDTNLVTDTRVKRYIRDFLKMQNKDIFVDMEGSSKVSADRRLENIIIGLLKEESSLLKILEPDFTQRWLEIRKACKSKDAVDLIKFMKDPKNKTLCYEVNLHLLAHIVKEKFIDIRLFGSAFAIAGFNRSYIGPVQLNWGYSLNKVKLMDSNSIVTIMNDDNSTFGKDYRVHYSLLAFNGTVNKFAAQHTGLTEADMEVFRKAIWQAIPALPTRSKINQYPKLYIEITYNDDYYNGHFGDLRQYVSLQSADERNIRSQKDYELNLTALEKLLAEHTGNTKPILEWVIQTPAGITRSN